MLEQIEANTTNIANKHKEAHGIIVVRLCWSQVAGKAKVIFVKSLLPR